MLVERTFWNLHSRAWDDELDRDGREARVAWLAAHARRGERLLDLGCGTGTYARALAEQGFAVVGLDFAAAMLARARTQTPQARFVQADLNEPLPFQAGAFDHALCVAALQCVRNPHRFLGDVHRVLRPGGMFLLVAVVPDSRPRRPAGHGLAEQLFWLVKLAAGQTRLVRCYAQPKLTALLRDAGFDIIDEQTSRGTLETLARATV